MSSKKVKTIINEKGVIGKPHSAGQLNIEFLKNNHDGIIWADSNGQIQSGTIAQKTSYQSEVHLDGVQEISSSVDSIIVINGLGPNSQNRNLTIFNTGTNIFNFPEVGGVYTIRFAGLADPVDGNPFLHIDFIVSGSDSSNHDVAATTRLSWETQVRNKQDHIHILAVYPVFVTEELFLSGGVLVADVESNAVNIISASVFIKEG